MPCPYALRRGETTLSARYRHTAHIRYRAALAAWMREHPKVRADPRTWRTVGVVGTPEWRDREAFLASTRPRHQPRS
jgi:hypothetical protein